MKHYKNFWKPFWYVVGLNDEQTQEAQNELGGDLIYLESRLVCKLTPIYSGRADHYEKPYIDHEKDA